MLATETPEETEARLHRARVSQQRVLATETPEEMEARLHRARVSQQRRLITDTPVETEARLQQLRVEAWRLFADQIQLGDAPSSVPLDDSFRVNS